MLPADGLALSLSQEVASELARFRWFDVVAPMAFAGGQPANLHSDDLMRRNELDYVVDDFPVRIVALDSTIPRKSPGLLTPEQLAWLDETLRSAPEKPSTPRERRRPRQPPPSPVPPYATFWRRSHPMRLRRLRGD